MKKIIFLFCSFLSMTTFAITFENACKELDAKVTGGSAFACRRFDSNSNTAIHRDGKDYVYATMFVNSLKADSSNITEIKRVAEVMKVNLSQDFYKSILNGKPGTRIGLKSNKHFVFWRNGNEKGQQDYSGLVIYPDTNIEAANPIVLCAPAGCAVDNNTKWYGPVEPNSIVR